MTPNCVAAAESCSQRFKRAVPFCVTQCLLLTVFTLFTGQLVSAAVTIPVQVDVGQAGNSQTIGTIVADGGFAGLGTVGSGLRADFTFADHFGFLDDRYDFDWVNVLTQQDFTSTDDGGSGPSSLFPNPPNIDPIPQEDDNLPFYYNQSEWFTNNTFAGVQIHEEGQYSRFLDIPNQPADRTFYFLSFLVLRDDGAYTLDGETEFCVLAGFSWSYQGAEGDFDSNRGTSTAVGSVTINQDVIDILTAGLQSEGAQIGGLDFKSDRFADWSAESDCTLVPEPSSLLLLGWGFAGAFAWKRKRASEI